MGKRKGTRKVLKCNQAQLEKFNENILALAAKINEIIDLDEVLGLEYKENIYDNLQGYEDEET